MAVLQCDEAVRLYVMLEIRADGADAVEAVLAGKKGCGRFKARRSRFQCRVILPDIRRITDNRVKPAACKGCKPVAFNKMDIQTQPFGILSRL